MKTYKEETIELAIERSDDIRAQFVNEVKRLLSSGALDAQHHSRAILFGVALENLADSYIRDRKDKEYKNLSRF